jgi:hypothetical protein
MTKQENTKRDGLTTIGKVVACVAVLMCGGFMVMKTNRTAAAAPVANAAALGSFECPVQPTGNGVAIPDIDPRCL